METRQTVGQEARTLGNTPQVLGVVKEIKELHYGEELGRATRGTGGKSPSMWDLGTGREGEG